MLNGLCMIGNPTSQDGIKIQGCLRLKNVIRQREKVHTQCLRCFPFNNARYGEGRNARFTLAGAIAYFSLSSIDLYKES